MPLTRLTVPDFGCPYPSIKRYLSGGAANSDHSLSLGGIRSNTPVDDTLLFGSVAAADVLNGYIDYRCLYFYNGSATLLNDVQIFVSGVLASVARDPAGVNGVAATISSPTIAPVLGSEIFGVSALLGDIAGSSFAAFWIKRNVPAEGNYMSAVAPMRVSWKLG